MTGIEISKMPTRESMPSLLRVLSCGSLPSLISAQH
jgi:hypothetical protein